ncbi:MAG TPA: tail fiber protein [Thermoanaerobaculia bacterium]|nr:tail fiber protein [Thermoanaerobaculia bacterium]
MSSPFVAEIRMFGFNFAPTGWAQCNGQLLPLSQNTALFSLLGTMYGGDGKSTFALPDLQGSAALNWGQSSTGTQYFEGQQAGSEFITLLQSEMPFHNHTLRAQAIDPSDVNQPGPTVVMGLSNNGNAYAPRSAGNIVNMNFQAASVAGASLPHNNMMPYLTVNFCIAMQGVFPARP